MVRNANEILGDDLGDDDGRCEAGEACVYMPHLGAYQGQGPLTSACSLQTGGPLTGTMPKISARQTL